jgi:hypothetical protein
MDPGRSICEGLINDAREPARRDVGPPDFSRDTSPIISIFTAVRGLMKSTPVTSSPVTGPSRGIKIVAVLIGAARDAFILL